ncbi:MAG: hypothetical protein PW790_14235 [Parvibaculaceae bacterium]|nr:hypothetical protein [Parvibaculaceae bacterium]
MTKLSRLVTVLAVFAVVVIGGFTYLAGVAQPSVQHVEKVLPDGQFPN